MYDYLIIGGGIIGLNIARELKLRDEKSKILLIEKEKEVIEVARRSLDMRWDLWDFILSKIESRESVNIR